MRVIVEAQNIQLKTMPRKDDIKGIFYAYYIKAKENAHYKMLKDQYIKIQT